MIMMRTSGGSLENGKGLVVSFSLRGSITGVLGGRTAIKLPLVGAEKPFESVDRSWQLFDGNTPLGDGRWQLVDKCNQGIRSKVS